VSRSTFDVVKELRDDLQQDVTESLGSDLFSLELEYDFMTREVHAWGKCAKCRRSYAEHEGRRPLLSISYALWEDARSVPIPVEWVPIMARSGMTRDRACVETINAAHEKLQEEPKQLRRFIAERIAWSVRRDACACIAREAA
jgi:hypothetical protein